MHTHLIKIGNSRGIRLPKAVIEAAGLEDELDLNVVKGAVVIRAAYCPRSEWARAAEACHREQDDCLEEWDTTLRDGDWS